VVLHLQLTPQMQVIKVLQSGTPRVSTSMGAGYLLVLVRVDLSHVIQHLIRVGSGDQLC
jgi:hypothetical protein